MSNLTISVAPLIVGSRGYLFGQCFVCDVISLCAELPE